MTALLWTFTQSVCVCVAEYKRGFGGQFVVEVNKRWAGALLLPAQRERQAQTSSWSLPTLIRNEHY